MFGLFGSVKMIFTIIIVIGLSGGVSYVYKLKADNATLKGNQIKMEQTLDTQAKYIEKQKQDFEAIMKANQEVNKLVGNLKKDIDDLDKRFNKGTRTWARQQWKDPKPWKELSTKHQTKH